MRCATAVFAAILASILVAGHASAEGRPGKACFYQRADFRGPGYCLEPGDSVPLLPPGWNNRITSIEIDRGIAVEICDQPRNRGRCATLDRSRPFLRRAGNNRVSSLRVERRRPRRLSLVCFYALPGFLGRQFCAEPGDVGRRLPPGWNNRVSSVQVQGDVVVEVCTRRGFRGRCRRFDRSVPLIGPRLDDNISSYRVTAVDVGGPGPGRGPRDDDANGDLAGGPDRVCFHSRRSYRGRSLCISAGDTLNQVPQRWRGQVASMRNWGGVIVEICDRSQLRGDCRIFDKSDAAVGPKWNSGFSSVRVY